VFFIGCCCIQKGRLPLDRSLLGAIRFHHPGRRCPTEGSAAANREPACVMRSIDATDARIMPRRSFSSQMVNVAARGICTVGQRSVRALRKRRLVASATVGAVLEALQRTAGSSSSLPGRKSLGGGPGLHMLPAPEPEAAAAEEALDLEERTRRSPDADRLKDGRQISLANHEGLLFRLALSASGAETQR
jgi:hypothetical protein